MKAALQTTRKSEFFLCMHKRSKLLEVCNTLQELDEPAEDFYLRLKRALSSVINPLTDELLTVIFTRNLLSKSCSNHVRIRGRGKDSASALRLAVEYEKRYNVCYNTPEGQTFVNKYSEQVGKAIINSAINDCGLPNDLAHQLAEIFHEAEEHLYLPRDPRASLLELTPEELKKVAARPSAVRPSSTEFSAFIGINHVAVGPVQLRVDDKLLKLSLKIPKAVVDFNNEVLPSNIRLLESHAKH